MPALSFLPFLFSTNKQNHDKSDSFDLHFLTKRLFWTHEHQSTYSYSQHVSYLRCQSTGSAQWHASNSHISESPRHQRHILSIEWPHQWLRQWACTRAYTSQPAEATLCFCGRLPIQCLQFLRMLLPPPQKAPRKQTGGEKE